MFSNQKHPSSEEKSTETVEKEPILFGTPRFNELLRKNNTPPAPNGKEQALIAWKRDARAAAWRRRPFVTEKNAQLLGYCGLSPAILNFPLDLVKKIGGYLHVNGQPFLPVESLMMLAISQSYYAHSALTSTAEKSLADIALLVERDDAILHSALYLASAKLMTPGIEEQLAFVMDFCDNAQKERMLHYLVGEANVAKEEGLSTKYSRYFYFILAHFSAWVESSDVSSKTQNRFNELIPNPKLSRTLSIFSPGSCSSDTHNTSSQCTIS